MDGTTNLTEKNNRNPVPQNKRPEPVDNDPLDQESEAKRRKESSLIRTSDVSLPAPQNGSSGGERSIPEMEKEQRLVKQFTLSPDTYPNKITIPRFRNDVKMNYFTTEYIKIAQFYARIFCFLCIREGDCKKEGLLVQCRGNHPVISGEQCKLYFHIGCIKKLKTDRFQFALSITPDELKGSLCPLHFCAACCIDKKDTANVGEIIQCARCCRGYHKECLPAGYETLKVVQKEGDVPVKMIKCQWHGDSPKVTGARPGICAHCGGTAHLRNCQKCQQQYHTKCISMLTVNVDASNNQRCRECLLELGFRVNGPVLMQNGDGWVLAKTKDWEGLPEDVIRMQYFNTAGYVAVQISDPMQELKIGIRHISTLLPLTNQYLTLANEENKLSWTTAIASEKNRLTASLRSILEHVTKKFTSIESTSTRIFRQPKTTSHRGNRDEELRLMMYRNSDGTGPSTSSSSSSRNYSNVPDFLEEVDFGFDNELATRRFNFNSRPATSTIEFRQRETMSHSNNFHEDFGSVMHLDGEGAGPSTSSSSSSGRNMKAIEYQEKVDFTTERELVAAAGKILLADLNPKSNIGKIPMKHKTLTPEMIIADRKLIEDIPMNTRHAWPAETSTPALRTNVTVNLQKTEAILQENKIAICILCKKKDGKKKLMQCHGCISDSDQNRCTSQFHPECLVALNCDNYGVQYGCQRECQDGVFCPLHSCAACSSDRQMQTAFAGRMMQCALCYRAFHETCIPAGYKPIDVNWHINQHTILTLMMILCNAHAQDLPRPSHHVEACLNCDSKKKKGLMPCDTCAHMTHLKCCDVQEVDGERAEMVPDEKRQEERRRAQCDYCLTKTTFRVESPVLIKLETGSEFVWKYAMARRWDFLPNSTTDIPGKEHFEEIGYVLIELERMFRIVPVNGVVPALGTYLYWPIQNTRTMMKWHKAKLDWEKEFEARLPDWHKVCHTQLAECVKVGRIVFQKEDQSKLCRCNVKSVTVSCKNCRYKNDVSNPTKENKKLAVGLTKLKGFGVFALEDIAAGEFLLNYTGEIINLEEKNRRTKLAKNDYQRGLYMLDVFGNIFIDSGAAGNISRYINHSCSPNTEERFCQIAVGNSIERRVFFVACKPIKMFEEITLDYEMKGDQKCFCMSENCGGTLAGPVKINKKSKK